MTLTPDFDAFAPNPTSQTLGQDQEAYPTQGAIITAYGCDSEISLDLDEDMPVWGADDGVDLGADLDPTVVSPTGQEGFTLDEVADLADLAEMANRPAAVPSVQMVVDRAYRFFDPAAAAVVAAIPPTRLNGVPLTLTHLQLRSLAVTAIMSLNDMNSDAEIARNKSQASPVADTGGAVTLRSVSAQEGLTNRPAPKVDPIDLDVQPARPRQTMQVNEDDLETGIVAMPPAEIVAERVERIIEELTKGFFTEVPRVDASLDDLDRAVKQNGFVRDEAWTRKLVQGAPATAYQLTPEGVAAGRLIRNTNAGDVKGFAGDSSTVALPTRGLPEGEAPITRISFAAAEAGHALMLDHLYGAMQFQPGELGQMLEYEAASIEESLSHGQSPDFDIVAGRIMSNLDTINVAPVAFLMDEEPGASLSGLPIRHEETRSILRHTLGSIAHMPALSTDPYVRESLSQADAVSTALGIIGTVQERSQGDDLDDPEIWNHVAEAFGAGVMDSRLSSLDPETAARFKQAGFNEKLADVELVSRDYRLAHTTDLVNAWISGSLAAGDPAYAQDITKAFLKNVPGTSVAKAA